MSQPSKNTHDFTITLNQSSDSRTETEDDDAAPFAGMSLNVLAQVASDQLHLDGRRAVTKKKVTVFDQTLFVQNS